MAVTIKHAKTDTIADWTQSDLDAQIAAGNYPPGTVLADIVLPSDWNNDHNLTGTVPIANGGTGQTTATDAINALLPSQATNTGKVLTTDGTNTSWQNNGNGTVTSVALTAPSIFSVAGSPITSSGTLALTYSGTALPVLNGGTGVTTSSGANSVVIRDANANITTNCLFEGFTSQAASTLITLTAASVQNWVITGSGGQTIKLPDATTLPNGALFTFNNNQSSGTIIVQNNSSTTVATLQSGAFSTLTLLNNSIAAGSWDKHDQAPSNVSWSTNTLDYAGSITSATWNGNVIALNRGGTNANLTAVNGGAVYSTGTALAISAAGTSGQVLTSSGAGAPTWTTPTIGTVTSVTGTSPVVSSGGATPAISMPAATTSVNGYLTSTDWTTFNNKGSGSVTSVSGTGSVNGITLTGTVTSSGSLTLGGTLGSIANSQLTNSSVTVNGTAISLGASGTVTATATNALTIGTGLSGTSYNGSTAVTIANSAPMTYPSGSGIAVVSSGTSWGTTLTAPSGTIVGTTDTQTLTNKRITTRSLSLASTSGAITPDSDTYDQVNYSLTGSSSFSNPTATTVTNGQKLSIRIYAASTQTVSSWSSSTNGYRAIGVTLPTSVAAGKTVYVGCIWNSTDSFWDVVAVATQA